MFNRYYCIISAKTKESMMFYILKPRHNYMHIKTFILMLVPGVYQSVIIWTCFALRPETSLSRALTVCASALSGYYTASVFIVEIVRHGYNAIDYIYKYAIMNEHVLFVALVSPWVTGTCACNISSRSCRFGANNLYLLICASATNRACVCQHDVLAHFSELDLEIIYFSSVSYFRKLIIMVLTATLDIAL